MGSRTLGNGRRRGGRRGDFPRRSAIGAGKLLPSPTGPVRPVALPGLLDRDAAGAHGRMGRVDAFDWPLPGAHDAGREKVPAVAR